MIEDFIQRAENRTKIAGETAYALKKIVEDIEQMAFLIGNITAAFNDRRKWNTTNLTVLQWQRRNWSIQSQLFIHKSMLHYYNSVVLTTLVCVILRLLE